MTSSTSPERAANPLRVAIIGYGLAGTVFHAPLIAATDGMTVSAIVTGNAERQQRDRAEAEDVSQEAYLRMFRGLAGFREEARFETWMHRIVTNCAISMLKQDEY